MQLTSPTPNNLSFAYCKQNRIFHGDCVEVIRRLPAECVDFILTDPPYLVDYRDRQGRAGQFRTTPMPIGSSQHLPKPTGCSGAIRSW